jgi:lyso-ornithine lipid O-acyltransferase
LRVFSIEVRSDGTVPHLGLLVSNHLSYLDILVLGSIARPTFVSKHEVRSWPVFGWLASLAGTIFVNREKRSEVATSTEQIREVLARGDLLVLFPEGTSSDGQTVLPFKSSLLEPVVEAKQPISGSYINYAMTDGDVGKEVCYWGDMTLGPHLLNLLGKRGIVAHVSFREIDDVSGNRKQLAQRLHATVLQLKEKFSEPDVPSGSVFPKITSG